jgi:hypothetical protein
MLSKRVDCKHITSITQLRRCGFGVRAEVKLKKPFINRFSGENIGPPIGTKGIVVGVFGSQPEVKWMKPGRYGIGPQVVPPEFLAVTKHSGRPEIIATIPLERLKRFQGDYRTAEIKDSKVCVWKNESIYDDAGYIVGDASYELRGRIKGGNVEFTSTRVGMSGVPQRERWGVRNYFESANPKIIFSELLEEK